MSDVSSSRATTDGSGHGCNRRRPTAPLPPLHEARHQRGMVDVLVIDRVDRPKEN